MDVLITVETEMFEHREVKPHFINPCCFGEDFAAWLKKEISPLTDSGFILSEPIQGTVIRPLVGRSHGVVNARHEARIINCGWNIRYNFEACLNGLRREHG